MKLYYCNQCKRWWFKPPRFTKCPYCGGNIVTPTIIEADDTRTPTEVMLDIADDVMMGERGGRMIWLVDIKDLIQKRGMKQADVARAIGIRPQYLHAIIVGERPLSIRYVVPLCKCLGITPNVLFGYERMFVPIDSDHVTSTSKWIRDLRENPQTNKTLTMGE